MDPVASSSGSTAVSGEEKYVSATSQGNSYNLPPDFTAKRLPEWRLAAFSVVLPIPEAASFWQETGGEFFDFVAADRRSSDHGEGTWKLGRAKGVQGMENPQWDGENFVKPSSGGYYKAFYNQAQSRFKNIRNATGAEAVDLGVARNKWQENQPIDCEKDLRDVNVRAHHFTFTSRPGITEFSLVNPTEERIFQEHKAGDPREDVLSPEEVGPSTLRLESFDVLQFADYYMHNFSGLRGADGAADGEKPSFEAEIKPPREKSVSQFIVLNVVAENLSSAALASLNSSLARPRSYVEVYDDTGLIEPNPIESQRKEYVHRGTNEHARNAGEGAVYSLKALPYFASLAVAELDRILGRTQVPSMKVLAGGSLGASYKNKLEGMRCVQLRQPTRVAMAVPNPQKPGESAPFRIDGPKILQDPSIGGEWRWHEQWAWLLSTGADPWEEVIPRQTPEVLRERSAGNLSTWSILASSEGIGMVRACPASNVGTRYWALANTRYVDILILQLRAKAALTWLNSSLQEVGTARASSLSQFDVATLDERNTGMRRDVRLLENLQLDLIEVRDKLWFTTVDSREVDSEILKSLQRSLGLRDLYDEVTTELNLRKSLLQSQYDGLRIEKTRKDDQQAMEERAAKAQRREEEERRRQLRREEEEKQQQAKDEREKRRAEVMNFFLAVTAAGLVGPDWATAVGEGNFTPAFVGFLVIAALVGVPLYLINQGRSAKQDGAAEKAAPQLPSEEGV